MSRDFPLTTYKNLKFQKCKGLQARALAPPSEQATKFRYSWGSRVIFVGKTIKFLCKIWKLEQKNKALELSSVIPFKYPYCPIKKIANKNCEKIWIFMNYGPNLPPESRSHQMDKNVNWSEIHAKTMKNVIWRK